MRRSPISALAATLAVALLAGCGGGGGGAGATPSIPVNQPQSGSATFVIKIPAKPTTSNSRVAHYVTSSVRSVDFSVSQAANTQIGAYEFFPLTPQATYCSSGGSGLTCTLQVNAPPGADTFSVNEYDNATEPGLGYLVATGTLTQTINANASNTVNIITYAVPIYILMGVDRFPSNGSSVALPLSMTASDADGNIIIGQFNGPITLSSTDATDVTFSKTILNTTSDFTGLTVNYDGMAVPSGSLNATPTFVNGNFFGWFGGFTGFQPGAAGVVASPPYLTFAHASSPPQTITLSAANGAGTPFTMTAASVNNPACSGYATVAGTSPTFTITPTASTFSSTPLNTVGICYVDAKPASGTTISIPVLISP